MRHITFQDDVFQEENGSRLQIFQANHTIEILDIQFLGKTARP